jgi:RNA-directed DNA polymerase
MNNVPIRRNVLRTWLKAGILDNGKQINPTEGVPQGGPISPTIFNYVMNGIEREIIKIRYCTPVRYADDLLVLARTNEQLTQAMETAQKFLEPRGLRINTDKTVMTIIDKGFKFLGY